MRARFKTRPETVAITRDGNMLYCQIAVNPEEIEVRDPETGEKRTEIECDYNSFCVPSLLIDEEAVRADPESFIDYIPENVTDSEQRLRDIENALAELGEIIGG